ncbi:MAG: hypothetical protein ACMZ7B_09590 [Balneola sp.]
MVPVVTKFEVNYFAYGLQILFLILILLFGKIKIDNFLFLAAALSLICLSIDFILFNEINSLTLKDTVFLIFASIIIPITKKIDHDKVYRFIIFLGVTTSLLAIYQSINNIYPSDFVLKPWNRIGPFIRAGVGYTEENYLASYLVFTYIAVHISSIKRINANIFKTIIFVGILFTFSRGGVISIIIFELIVSKERKSIIILILIGSIGLMLTPDLYVDTIFSRFSSSSTEASSSTYSRINQFNDALVELTNFKTFLLGQVPNYTTSNGQVIHNTVLYLLVDYGLILGLFYFSVLGIVFKRYLNIIALPLLVPMFFLNLLGFKLITYYIILLSLYHNEKSKNNINSISLSGKQRG